MSTEDEEKGEWVERGEGEEGEGRIIILYSEVYDWIVVRWNEHQLTSLRPQFLSTYILRGTTSAKPKRLTDRIIDPYIYRYMFQNQT